jgi:hypothetical protein
MGCCGAYLNPDAVHRPPCPEDLPEEVDVGQQTHKVPVTRVATACVNGSVSATGCHLALANL